MHINCQRFHVHEYKVKEVDALYETINVLEQIQNIYDEKVVLGSPNDGEIIQIEELARVKGVLDFLVRNRVVEVNP